MRRCGMRHRERRKEAELRLAAEQKATTAEKRATAAEQKLQSTEGELRTAKERASTAEQKLLSAEKELVTARDRTARLAELSRKVIAQQATPDEILELQRLLESPP